MQSVDWAIGHTPSLYGMVAPRMIAVWVLIDGHLERLWAVSVEGSFLMKVGAKANVVGIVFFAMPG